MSTGRYKLGRDRKRGAYSVKDTIGKALHEMEYVLPNISKLSKCDRTIINFIEKNYEPATIIGAFRAIFDYKAAAKLSFLLYQEYDRDITYKKYLQDMKKYQIDINPWFQVENSKTLIQDILWNIFDSVPDKEKSERFGTSNFSIPMRNKFINILINKYFQRNFCELYYPNEFVGYNSDKTFLLFGATYDSRNYEMLRKIVEILFSKFCESEVDIMVFNEKIKGDTIDFSVTQLNTKSLIERTEEKKMEKFYTNNYEKEKVKVTENEILHRYYRFSFWLLSYLTKDISEIMQGIDKYCVDILNMQLSYEMSFIQNINDNINDIDSIFSNEPVNFTEQQKTANFINFDSKTIYGDRKEMAINLANIIFSDNFTVDNLFKQFRIKDMTKKEFLAYVIENIKDELDEKRRSRIYTYMFNKGCTQIMKVQEATTNNWNLPKGKVEKFDPNYLSAAIREIMEETQLNMYPYLVNTDATIAIFKRMSNLKSWIINFAGGKYKYLLTALKTEFVEALINKNNIINDNQKSAMITNPLLNIIPRNGTVPYSTGPNFFEQPINLVKLIKNLRKDDIVKAIENNIKIDENYSNPEIKLLENKKSILNVKFGWITLKNEITNDILYNFLDSKTTVRINENENYYTYSVNELIHLREIQKLNNCYNKNLGKILSLAFDSKRIEYSTIEAYTTASSLDKNEAYKEYKKILELDYIQYLGYYKKPTNSQEIHPKDYNFFSNCICDSGKDVYCFISDIDDDILAKAKPITKTEISKIAMKNLEQNRYIINKLSYDDIDCKNVNILTMNGAMEYLAKILPGFENRALKICKDLLEEIKTSINNDFVDEDDDEHGDENGNDKKLINNLDIGLKEIDKIKKKRPKIKISLCQREEEREDEKKKDFISEDSEEGNTITKIQIVKQNNRNTKSKKKEIAQHKNDFKNDFVSDSFSELVDSNNNSINEVEEKKIELPKEEIIEEKNSDFDSSYISESSSLK